MLEQGLQRYTNAERFWMNSSLPALIILAGFSNCRLPEMVVLIVSNWQQLAQLSFDYWLNWQIACILFQVGYNYAIFCKKSHTGDVRCFAIPQGDLTILRGDLSFIEVLYSFKIESNHVDPPRKMISFKSWMSAIKKEMYWLSFCYQRIHYLVGW